MNRFLCAATILLLIVGCAGKTPRPEIIDRVTEVPTIVCEEHPQAARVDLTRPLPIDNITEDTPDNQVAALYVLTVELLSSEVEQLLEALRPFRGGDQ